MPRKSKRMDYTKIEVQRRFVAALRGARIAGHKPKDSMTPKRPRAQRSKRAKGLVRFLRHRIKRRVISQSDLFAAGSVRFPQRAGWLEDFTAELLAFPGRHDDQVDALVQALAWSRSRRGEFFCGVVKGLI
jgi:hypothetical protein